MSYYCFLCNDDHDDLFTQEHFIPRSIDGPENQWLPVCEASNTRSNSIFDNEVRDMLYWVRFEKTGALKRSGEALLADGVLRPFRFSYFEGVEPRLDSAFRYIYDRDTNRQIPPETVFAIAFPVGLRPQEQETYCRGLAKISIGALAYLLKDHGVDEPTIKRMFSQTSIDAIRVFALNLPWRGEALAMRFPLGRSDIIEQLQSTCKSREVRNHVVRIVFQEQTTIHIEGMLYSHYAWMFDLTNRIAGPERELRLENAIAHMPVPTNLKDLTLSQDTICIYNPSFIGDHPAIPIHWQNRNEEKQP
jgi:hypothetical protein